MTTDQILDSFAIKLDQAIKARNWTAVETIKISMEAASKLWKGYK